MRCPPWGGRCSREGGVTGRALALWIVLAVAVRPGWAAEFGGEPDDLMAELGRPHIRASLDRFLALSRIPAGSTRNRIDAFVDVPGISVTLDPTDEVLYYLGAFSGGASRQRWWFIFHENVLVFMKDLNPPPDLAVALPPNMPRRRPDELHRVSPPNSPGGPLYLMVWSWRGLSVIAYGNAEEDDLARADRWRVLSVQAILIGSSGVLRVRVRP